MLEKKGAATIPLLSLRKAGVLLARRDIILMCWLLLKIEINLTGVCWLLLKIEINLTGVCWLLLKIEINLTGYDCAGYC